MARKVSKQAAHYGQGMKSAHCGICNHYLGNGRCNRVEGIVSPSGWCKFFARKPDASRFHAHNVVSH